MSPPVGHVKTAETWTSVYKQTDDQNRRRRDDAKPGGALTFLGCLRDPGVSKHERVTDVYTGLATFIHHLLKGHTVFSVMAEEEVSPKRHGLHQPHAVQGSQADLVWQPPRPTSSTTNLRRHQNLPPSFHPQGASRALTGLCRATGKTGGKKVEWMSLSLALEKYRFKC